jgi:hypothetical protein
MPRLNAPRRERVIEVQVQRNDLQQSLTTGIGLVR